MKSIILILLTIIALTSCFPISNNPSIEEAQTQIENLNEGKEILTEFQETPMLSNMPINEKQTVSEDTNINKEDQIQIENSNESKDNTSSDVPVDEKQIASENINANEENSVFNPIGCWNNSPVVGSQLSDTYVFREDGTFTFYYNEYFYSIRETSFSGTWTRIDDTLYLKKLKKRIIAGGELVPFNLSADGYMIEGGEEKTEEINPSEEIILIIGEYDDNSDGHDNYPSIFLDDKQYWQLYDTTSSLSDRYWE